MLCVPAPSMLAYNSSLCGDSAKQIGSLLRETATMNLTIMSLLCFIWAAEYGVAILFFTSRLQAWTDNGSHRAIKSVPVLLPGKKRANILKWGPCASSAIVRWIPG